MENIKISVKKIIILCSIFLLIIIGLFIFFKANYNDSKSINPVNKSTIKNSDEKLLNAKDYYDFFDNNQIEFLVDGFESINDLDDETMILFALSELTDFEYLQWQDGKIAEYEWRDEFSKSEIEDITQKIFSCVPSNYHDLPRVVVNKESEMISFAGFSNHSEYRMVLLDSENINGCVDAKFQLYRFPDYSPYEEDAFFDFYDNEVLEMDPKYDDFKYAIVTTSFEIVETDSNSFYLKYNSFALSEKKSEF